MLWSILWLLIFGNAQFSRGHIGIPTIRSPLSILKVAYYECCSYADIKVSFGCPGSLGRLIRNIGEVWPIVLQSSRCSYVHKRNMYVFAAAPPVRCRGLDALAQAGAVVPIRMTGHAHVYLDCTAECGWGLAPNRLSFCVPTPPSEH